MKLGVFGTPCGDQIPYEGSSTLPKWLQNSVFWPRFVRGVAIQRRGVGPKQQDLVGFHEIRNMEYSGDTKQNISVISCNLFMHIKHYIVIIQQGLYIGAKYTLHRMQVSVRQRYGNVHKYAFCRMLHIFILWCSGSDIIIIICSGSFCAGKQHI